MKSTSNEGEIVSPSVSDKDLQEEVNRRTAKAGFTTKYGEPPCRTKIMAQPPNNKYRENYKRIFGHD